nr:RRXRR protein [uncultured bacterium]
MSGLVFVCDADGTPLMPMAPAHARRLLQRGQAVRRPHHAFTVLQLTKSIPTPVLRPVTLTITIHMYTAELLLTAAGRAHLHDVCRILVDLRTDLGWRL